MEKGRRLELMKFAVLDFETTGTGPADDIIQVGLVIIDDMEVTDRYTSLVNPGISIPSSITELTGITDEMVEHAPKVDDIMAEMYPLLFDCVLVAHHASFDLGFLQRALRKTGYPDFTGRVLDTIDMLRIVFPSLPTYQLGMVASAFGIEHERPHQADSDADVTAEIWTMSLDRLLSLPLLTVQRLAQIMPAETSDLGWFMSEIARFKEQQTPLDQSIHQYYRQFALNVQDWGDEDPVRDENDVLELSNSFEDVYDQVKEALKAKFEHFESREAQEIMIREIEEAFQNDRHLMIEAGTGTGKSLGYLIPSLYYGIKHDEKVVVSTHTINLQEQLRERDIPLLHDIFPVNFKASVLKGRSHYLCLRKFENRISMQEFDTGKEDAITAAQMVVWLSQTQTGDEEELHFGNKGAAFWHTVSSDAESCQNRHCPWFKKCFYHRARHDANNSDVVITNHSLLFTDMKAENRVLPAYKHLVLDEAHHFEEVASKHLGKELHYLGLTNQLLWLFKDSRNGQLPALRTKLQRYDDDYRAATWMNGIDNLFPKTLLIKEAWDLLCEKFYELLQTNSEPGQIDPGSLVMRLKKESLPSNWSDFTDLEEILEQHIQEVYKSVDSLVQDLKEVQEEYDVQSFVTDLGGVAKELQAAKETLRFFMKMADDNFVYWVEAGTYNKSRSINLISVPMDVSPLIREHFFDNKESVILTSATLSVNKSFQYSADQLGLKLPAEAEENPKLKTVQLPSPFQYRQQALVCIPRDFPMIRGRSGEEEFLKALTESLTDVAVATRGRMLVLFTSNRMLKLAHAVLKENLRPHGIHVLGQGVDTGNRSKLTRLFQEHKACVLFGTSSFWEGVDIPGDALTCLAIVRLPFQPPNHPLVEAKSENLKKRNQNPFMKLSVPQAVIRFKQGFGRLVRRASDKGIVLIYDTRVIETQYGKHFLYSLPGPKIEHMPVERIVPRIQEWMGENSLEVT
ncbi:ATP-dependent DNA helicase DinG [Paenibacillus chitinolyticus]|uniref:ATP-dependent DNA helicase DinG n=1 Tax=Paenibacillus chitinolyticus TaxID=79263 RepID=UPI00364F8748